MDSRGFTSWMLGDALSLLERAERMHRHFQRASRAHAGSWEPPIDVVETGDALVIHVALPGVSPADVVVAGDAGGITVSGVRALPASGAAQIHRIEIPYGRFERRIVLPMRALEPAGSELVDGCLVLRFTKGKEAS